MVWCGRLSFSPFFLMAALMIGLVSLPDLPPATLIKGSSVWFECLLDWLIALYPLSLLFVFVDFFKLRPFSYSTNIEPDPNLFSPPPSSQRPHRPSSLMFTPLEGFVFQPYPLSFGLVKTSTPLLPAAKSPQPVHTLLHRVLPPIVQASAVLLQPLLPFTSSSPIFHTPSSGHLCKVLPCPSFFFEIQFLFIEPFMSLFPSPSSSTIQTAFPTGPVSLCPFSFIWIPIRLFVPFPAFFFPQQSPRFPGF